MNNVSKLDFTGQQIYVGMDVHRKNWSISIYTDHFEHKTFSQPPEVGVLVNYLNRNFPGAAYKAVYEAGFSGFWIHDLLQKHGVPCLVVNPADVPTKDKERAGKTDRVDCRKLARSLRNGEIEGIYVPARFKVEDRNLLRTRHSMVRKQTRCKNQIKAILHFYGIQTPEDFTVRSWSKRFIKIESIQMARASGDMALKAHLSKSVPGISTLTAMTLLTELYDISRFKTLDKLCSYVGLIPDTKSSGETDRKTSMTGRRNVQLRVILIESAWTAVRKDPALTMAFGELCKHMPKTKAIVRIARKLLNRIRHVLKHQQEYVPAVVQ